MKENMKKLFSVVVFIVIFFIQILNYRHIYELKEQSTVDEFLTLQYAHFFASDDSNITYLTDMVEWKYDIWQSVNAFKETMTIDDNTSILSVPLGKAFKLMIKRRTYFGFVNMIGSMVTNHRAWFGGITIFNTILTFLTEFMLFCVVKKMTGNHFLGVCSIILWGFSGIVGSMTVYIRFYAWLGFLCMLVIFLHYFAWEKNSFLTITITMFGSFFAMYLALRNSEMALPFYGLVFVSFIIILLSDKRYKQCILYGGFTSACGIIYLILGTDFLDALFHSERYKENGKLGEAIVYASGFGLESLILGIKEVIENAWKYFFGSRLVTIICVILILTALIICVIDKFQYIKNIGRFVVAIALSFVGYSTFVIVTGIASNARHFLPAYLMLNIIVMYAFYIIVNKITVYYGDKQYASICRISVYVIICMIVVYSGYKTFKRSDYQFVIREKQHFYDKMDEYDANSRILVESTEYHGGHYLYDCIECADWNSRICIVHDDADELAGIISEKENVILWFDNKSELVDQIIKNLELAGHNIEYIGDSLCSSVYLLIQ